MGGVGEGVWEGRGMVDGRHNHLQLRTWQWLVHDLLSLLYGSFSFLTTPKSSSISVGMM